MSVTQKFQTLHVSEVARDLDTLCNQIAADHGRVQVNSANGSCDCVLISKIELDSLENALEILADSETGRGLAEDLSQLVHLAHPHAAA
jgi:PHD/YefM family antitoxin component YafN of YafNO toxin-antitoxin module